MANANVPPDVPDKELLKGLPANLVTCGEFFLDSARLLKWGDLSQSTVMDIGCGTDSPKLFKVLFPNVNRLIGLDRSQTFTFLNYFHRSAHMEFHVADVTRRNTLERWKSQMTKIVSFFCLQWLVNQKTALENIYYMLKPGGEAIILSGLRNPHYLCAKHILDKPKWEEFENLIEAFPDHEAHGEGINFYKNILSELQFEVISCREDHRMRSFATEAEFRDSGVTEDRVIAKHLPARLRDEFKEEYMQALMTIEGRLPNGELCIRTSTVRIILRKPSEN